MTHSTRPGANLIKVLALCAFWIGWEPSASVRAADVQGFTEPYQDIDVAAAETGIVEAVLVKEGDRVKKGQMLVRMDAAVLELTMEIAKSIKESRGRLESAKEELALQTAMVSKLEELQSRQHASRQEIERAQTQQRIAAAQVKAIQEELNVKTLEYERARVQLERRRLRSPIDGIVTRIFKDVGESVLLNDPTLVKVVQLDPLLVVFLVPAEHARKVADRKTVNVRIENIAKPVRGEVEFVSPTVDPQSGLTRVRVRLANPDERLPCGATCYLLIDDRPPQRVRTSR